MLFNSYAFLFGFLPVVLIGYQLVGRLHRKAVVIWLGIASLLFYGYWKPEFLLVLGSSILFNFLFSNLISRTIPNSVPTSIWMWTAIVIDLGALCWFKYLFPVLNFFGERMHQTHHWNEVLLPLGISFFTFTQIAYLVDLQQGGAEQQDFSSYVLFVSFFPHLIAGPILHHKDIMPQFQQDRVYGLQFNDLAIGLSWFAMGMCKKVLLADQMAPTVAVIFSAHGAIGPGTAWVGALTYALQLYFDFSGYCDMALGLARMLSIDFPINFSSPYKAANIIEFWQRWHITLTEYIGAYLYSPIQFQVSAYRQDRGKKVSRKAQATLEGYLQMVALPTVTTMFIAGIWHGAGSQYLIFGLLHGVFLSLNHGWRNFRHQRNLKSAEGQWRLPARAGGVLLTFVFVVCTLVFFRSASTHEAVLVLERMAWVHPAAGSGTLSMNLQKQIARMIAGFIVVWGFPNTQQILARYKPALALPASDGQAQLLPLFWKPNLVWALLLGGGMFVALVEMQDPSIFLYFQF